MACGWSFKAGTPRPAITVRIKDSFLSLRIRPAGTDKVKYNTRNPKRYFDPSAFQLPLGYSNSTVLGGAFIGNAGGGILTLPGSAKVDFVPTKEAQIGERLQL